MESPKPTKSYAEIEAAYLAKMDKLNKKKLAFEAKQEKEKSEFLAKHEKKELKIQHEFDVAMAECDEPPPPLGIMVQHDPTNLGEY